jgi:hypothetical protein
LDTLLRLKLRQVGGARMLSAQGGDIHLLSRCVDDSSGRLANVDVGNDFAALFSVVHGVVLVVHGANLYGA